MLSFIIPAHNEERWIAACLGSIRTAMGNIDEPYELIVVDDASTDATTEIARQLFNDWQQCGDERLTPYDQRRATYTLIRVELRKIAAVRNVGARAAGGENLFFIDADTQANEPAIRASLAALRAGAAGGGCAPEFHDPRPLWASVLIWIAVTTARRIQLVGGCFQFCTRDSFNAVGGYNENFRAGEDMVFCQDIKKIGRFVVPQPAVVTSARKLNVVTPWQLISLFVTIALRGPRYESDWIIDILYGDRAQASRNPNDAMKDAK
jgi:glycosyltransferase involved in cell wall biosynthesis